MTEINDTPAVEEAPAAEETPAVEEKEYSGRKIMCFVSKQMVPIEDTVEVEYSTGKSYRVMEKYIRYEH